MGLIRSGPVDGLGCSADWSVNQSIDFREDLSTTETGALLTGAQYRRLKTYWPELLLHKLRLCLREFHYPIGSTASSLPARLSEAIHRLTLALFAYSVIF
jgi:hypothetical protein